MANILTNAYSQNNNYYIKDNNSKLHQNYVVIYLHVVNLFGNISKELVTSIIIGKWQQIKSHTNINKNVFLEVVHFIFDNNYYIVSWSKFSGYVLMYAKELYMINGFNK